jgi:dTDP-4-dehydrorhamnose 3,5-epimerase
VRSEVADVVYKVSNYFDPATEAGFAFDDPDVGIEWPELDLIVSERDRTAPKLADLRGTLPW